MKTASPPAGIVRAVLLTGLLSPPLLFAQESPRIETLMSEEELAKSGLDGLTSSQLEALNDWLLGHMALKPEAADPSREPGTTAASSAAPADRRETGQRGYGEREEIADVISSIKGEFTGWDGKTVFRLENGQVYQQRRPGRWKTELRDPRVRIEKSFIGYELIVEDHSIGVKRLR